MSERRPEQEREASAQAGASYVVARNELAAALAQEGISIPANRLEGTVADYLDLRAKLMLIRAAVRGALDG